MPITDILRVADTILNGQSVSAGAKLDWSHAINLTMPAGWTAAAITLQVSQDGVTYANLFDGDGVEVTIQAAAGREIVLPVTRLSGFGWVRLRSGTSGTPVPQGADRAFTWTMRRYL